MPASDPTAPRSLQSVAQALHGWAAGALGALGTQIWVADDVGFHPRAVVGRECDDGDRHCARQSCILDAPVQEGGLLALPLRLSDRSSGACLFALPAPLAADALPTVEHYVLGVNALLDAALHTERLARLSGLARKSDLLRATLALAHTLEHCPALPPVMAQLHTSLSAIMYADNFFVVVLDERREQLVFHYIADTYEVRADPIAFHQGRMQGSLSAFVVAAGRVLRGSSMELLQQAGHMDKVEEYDFGPPATDWLGVPMMVANEAIGAVVVQSYDADIRFTDADPSMLSMVADTMAAALHRRSLREALERTVAERTLQLEASNQSLQATVGTLERAMTELVQAEKLASLGSMVAGISHELNTPIGNALTVASALQERFETLVEQSASGKMTRSGLAEFMASGLDMSGLVVRATQRAAELIASFKQVAVDQTSAQRRSFDVHQVVEELLIALSTTVDRPGIHIENAIPAGLLCDSYPGPLGQVVANLVQNALLHAFDPQDGGRITLAAVQADSMTTIRITDDGVGMTPQVLARAFDPFFTTRLGRGGSGLGLAVCHRIVTSVLGGELTVTSMPGQGSCFVLEFPAQAPYKL